MSLSLCLRIRRGFSEKIFAQIPVQNQGVQEAREIRAEVACGLDFRDQAGGKRA